MSRPAMFDSPWGALGYLDHPYNVTAENERSIEVPIALAWLDAVLPVPLSARDYQPRLLEVGNVLRNYPFAPRALWTPPPQRRRHAPLTHPRLERWDVVDLTDPGPGVLNVDVHEFDPVHLYDAILSVSTVEHVGWDVDGDPDAARQAIDLMRSWLRQNGRMLVTFPIGHHPHLDEWAADGFVDEPVDRWPDRTWLYVRTGDSPPWTWELCTEWDEGDVDDRPAILEAHPYDRETPSARAVWVGEYLWHDPR